MLKLKIMYNKWKTISKKYEKNNENRKITKKDSNNKLEPNCRKDILKYIGQ